VLARLEAPVLAERRQEAHRRLETYRQRLRTLRTARDYVAMMRSGRGERLETVRQTLAQIQENAAKSEAAAKSEIA
jgi:hypothetical protein